MRGWKAVTVAAAMLAAGQACAEDVDLVGTFPAGNRDVAMLRSIAVARFAGRDGAPVALALERALARAEIDGRPHFVVRPDPEGAEGVIEGAVSTDVSESDFTRRDKRCVERDARDKCVRKEEVRIPCARRSIEVTVEARVSDVRRRQVIWSGETERSASDEWCRGESEPTDTRTVIDRLIGDLGNELRRTFAPTTRRYSVRFRENTKGLDRDLARQFKDVVRQSKRDLPGACSGWTAIERAAPDHVGTVFDLGVCAEAAGDFDEALARYQRASFLLGRGNEAEQDVGRVEGLIHEREDAAIRAGQGPSADSPDTAGA